MASIDWNKLYEKYKGLWVALNRDNETVVGAGATPQAALEEAKSKAIYDAALTFVPPEVIAFAGKHEAALHEATIRF